MTEKLLRPASNGGRLKKPSEQRRYRTFVLVYQLVLLGWFALITFPLLSGSTPETEEDFLDMAETANAVWSYIAFSFILCMDIVYLKVIAKISITVMRASALSASFVAVFCLIAIVSLINGQPLAFANAAAAIILYSNLLVFWTLSESDQTVFFKRCSYLLAAFLMAGLVYHGVPAGINSRWLGGIHPNIVGASIVAICIFSLASRSRLAPVLFCFAMWMGLTISSRYAMVTGVLSLMQWMALRSFSGDEKPFVRVISVLAILAAPLAILVGWDFVANAMMLDDSSRGLGSGVSGRADVNATFAPQLAAEWLTGYGFRQRSEYSGAHNGTMNLLLELGVIVGPILLSLIVVQLVRLQFAALARGKTGTTVAAAAGLLGLSFAAQLQPQLINFGDPMGIAILLILAFNPFGSPLPARPAQPSLGRSRIGTSAPQPETGQ